MRAYIQCGSNGLPYNMNTFSAMLGFQQMGIETVLFNDKQELTSAEISDIVVGGVGRVKQFLTERGIVVNDIDYPDSLSSYYGRKIWETTSDTFLSEKKNFPLFIKPKQGKLFVGFICNSEADIAGRFSPEESIPVYCSEVRNIVTEWRCFVRYGEILDIRHYKGELGKIYYLKTVKDMVRSYVDSPSAYSIDIGLTAENETIIVEVNDGYSLGSYGLDPLLYAKLLSARWAELTGTEDECAFDIR